MTVPSVFVRTACDRRAIISQAVHAHGQSSDGSLRYSISPAFTSGHQPDRFLPSLRHALRVKRGLCRRSVRSASNIGAAQSIYCHRWLRILLGQKVVHRACCSFKSHRQGADLAVAVVGLLLRCSIRHERCIVFLRSGNVPGVKGPLAGADSSSCEKRRPPRPARLR